MSELIELLKRRDKLLENNPHLKPLQEYLDQRLFYCIGYREKVSTLASLLYTHKDRLIEEMKNLAKLLR